MTRVEFRGIVKRFGQVTALHEVNLVIEPGEFFILLGPSGSGKSTMLRILAGLEQPTGGSLWFGEDDVTRLPPWKRQTAMVFQNYALYPHMSVEDNIAYPLTIRKMSKDEKARRVRETAEVFQVDHLLSRKPTELSGGQQQRVALARALVQKPRLFLFDEPLSNLDARLRLEARTFLKTIQRELGITSIYVTHDQVEAMALSDRMAVLEFGHLRQVGTTREVYHHPADPFVAGFLGTPPMNLVEVEWKGGRALLGDSSLAVPGASCRDGKALLGVRPEHLSFASEGEGLKARVVVNEDFGHELWVTLEVAGQHLVLRSREPLTEGVEGVLVPEPDRLHLFPKE